MKHYTLHWYDCGVYQMSDFDSYSALKDFIKNSVKDHRGKVVIIDLMTFEREQKALSEIMVR